MSEWLGVGGVDNPRVNNSFLVHDSIVDLTVYFLISLLLLVNCPCLSL